MTGRARRAHSDLGGRGQAGEKGEVHPAGDVAGALLAAMPGSGIDALMGTGGTPEGIMSACAIRGLGGEFIGRLDPQLQTEKQAVGEVMLSLGMPIPVSDTAILTWRVSVSLESISTVMSIEPFSVNLIALLIRLSRICRARMESA